MTDVLIATCADLPRGDEDADVLAAALTTRGLVAEWAVWDDPSVDWTGALVVIRSTWDYTPRRAEFLEWARTVGRLHNPPEVLAWNSDKLYLRDLAGAGVPIVPTFWAAPGEPVTLPDTPEFVIKPSVGAGSRGAGRFTAEQADAARAHAAALHDAGRTVMAQPYLSGVDAAGETALIYLDGRFSHAVRKAPMLPKGTVHDLSSYSLYVDETIGARVPHEAELAVGDAAMQVLRTRFGGELLYVRVDLLPGEDGPVVIELEATEPSLFLVHADGAAERLAAAIARRV
jgi:glutathione synthase/RimK-type ligase-like ATP-grasp enzyme